MWQGCAAETAWVLFISKNSDTTLYNIVQNLFSVQLAYRDEGQLYF